MLTELGDTPVEGLDGGVGSGQHHSTFHHRKNIGRKRFPVGAFGEPSLDVLDTLPHCSDPTLKIFGDQRMSRTVLGIDFQSQAAERAAVFAFRLKNSFAITCQDRKNSGDRILSLCVGRVHHHRPESGQVRLEDRPEQRLFAFKEVIEMALDFFPLTFSSYRVLLE
jgi:hypothetical protein